MMEGLKGIMSEEEVLCMVKLLRFSTSTPQQARKHSSQFFALPLCFFCFQTMYD